jgi:hypothetical protein
MKTWLDWCRNRAVPFSVMDFANKAVLLDPGEFVARWETCACRERDASGNYEPEQDCWKCDGKGSYAVPVEVEK